MNIYAFGPIAALLDGAYAVVVALSDLLAPVAGIHAAALAIVLVTLLLRTALIPVGVSQARAQRMRLRLAPRLAELRRRHAKNPERLQRETMALYADENASPFAGCLPLIIQAPVLSLIYGLFLLPAINGHQNTLLTETLAGAPLGTSFSTALTSGTDAAGVVVSSVILVLIAAIALASRRFTMRTAARSAAASGSTAAGSTAAGTAAPGTAASAPAAPALRPSSPAASTPPGALAAFGPDGGATRILSWLPLLTVVFAAFVPLAASLYLLITTAWSLAERTLLARLIR